MSVTKKQAFVAFLYGTLNIVFLLFNKYVFFGYKFYYVNLLVVCQLLVTAVLCAGLRFLGFISYPDFSYSIVMKNLPIALTYTLNSAFALAALAHLSLSMYSSLKRASLLVVLWVDTLYFHRPVQPRIVFSVVVMVVGTVISGLSDLEFDAAGYLYAFICMLMKAGNLVLVAASTKDVAEKKQRDMEEGDSSSLLFGSARTLTGIPSEESPRMKERGGISSPSVSSLNDKQGTPGLIFYSSVLSLPPMIVLCLFLTDFREVYALDLWNSLAFKVSLFVFVVEGVILNCAVYYCIAYTSALTTSVVSNMKLPFVAFVGLVFFGEARSGQWYMGGLFISILGSIMYSIESAAG